MRYSFVLQLKRFYPINIYNASIKKSSLKNNNIFILVGIY